METADDPASRNLASPPLNQVKNGRNNGLPNAIQNFIKNQTLNLVQSAEAVEYIQSRYFGNACEYYDSLKTVVKLEDAEKDFKLDCSTFHKGIMKKGIFAALNAYLELAQQLASRVVYFAENKEAD